MRPGTSCGERADGRPPAGGDGTARRVPGRFVLSRELDRLEQIGGLIVMVCNIGIALGAVGGGVLVDGVSAGTPLAVGGVTAVAGGAILVTLRRRR
ncbi:hypothetical protein ACIA8K_23060 [Catenuloplanes sp. NPDC051500]|uniref:hypothetical protein n=1 Tax=Catenuloplanes sp. NPDC051500 TaxID=3363959 RepID=UPI0037898435